MLAYCGGGPGYTRTLPEREKVAINPDDFAGRRIVWVENNFLKQLSFRIRSLAVTPITHETAYALCQALHPEIVAASARAKDEYPSMMGEYFAFKVERLRGLIHEGDIALCYCFEQGGWILLQFSSLA